MEGTAIYSLMVDSFKRPSSCLALVVGVLSRHRSNYLLFGRDYVQLLIVWKRLCPITYCLEETMSNYLFGRDYVQLQLSIVYFVFAVFRCCSQFVPCWRTPILMTLWFPRSPTCTRQIGLSTSQLREAGPRNMLWV